MAKCRIIQTTLHNSPGTHSFFAAKDLGEIQSGHTKWGCQILVQ